jgi:hypothetical protein
MNSLLQTLFMTPEFRRSLYLWRGGKGLTKDEEDDSIPLQLQRLFARLQFSEGSSAISTQALTQSFGWDSGQSFVQQDAQELCRVLFDVIEEHFAGTSEGTLLSPITLVWKLTFGWSLYRRARHPGAVPRTDEGLRAVHSVWI